MSKQKSIYLPLAMLLAVFATVMALSPITPSHIQSTPYNEIRWVQQDTRSAKTICLDNSNNMIQAWRCKIFSREGNA
jgi:hypothetical protein